MQKHRKKQQIVTCGSCTEVVPDQRPQSLPQADTAAKAIPTQSTEDVRPPQPFPQRLKKHKEDTQFKKSFDMLDQLLIDVPFLDALDQMHTYTKFLNDIITKKRKIERRVPANAATINAILGLPNTEPSLYTMLGGFEEEDFELIKDYLCEENTTWNTMSRNPHSISRLSLRPEAKLWNTFVKRNIMPTSHNQMMDRTRLLLIHTIMTGFRINVGEILAKEHAASCANDKGILAFPCFISILCRRATVPTIQGDKF
ncbi:hypothetical protein GQ457_13G017370 [Hibiscus cannabinus]